MEFNTSDIKKATMSIDDDYGSGSVSGSGSGIGSGSSAEVSSLAHIDGPDPFDGVNGSGAALAQDDNAQTEHYFSNERKMPEDFNFEHVDPQAFVQRMSAGAKEAQEQLDAKFATNNQYYDKNMQSYYNQQNVLPSMSDLTMGFMNSERSYVPTNLKQSNTLVESNVSHGSSDEFVKANNAMIGGDKIFTTADGMSDSRGDPAVRHSNTEQVSVSHNPSPAKKNPSADNLIDQDNEKFISSEDLLSDFKDDSVGKVYCLNATLPMADESKILLSGTAVTADLCDEGNKYLSMNVHSFPKATAIAASEGSSTTPKDFHTTVVQPIKKLPVNALPIDEIFYKYGLDAWFQPERLHPKVESLIYWRDVKKSGVVFGVGLVTLLAISCLSVISVFAYLSLATLFGTVALRIYKSVLQAIQKTTDGHPFKEYLDVDLSLSQEKVQKFTGRAVNHINGLTAELKRLFFVEDLVDSIKFGVILWTLTYLGAWINGMTIVLLAFVSVFTLPKVYENNQQSIDTYLDLVRGKLTELMEKLKLFVPIGNKKLPITDVDKDK